MEGEITLTSSQVAEIANNDLQVGVLYGRYLVSRLPVPLPQLTLPVPEKPLLTVVIKNFNKSGGMVET